ncbi:MAG: FAD-dependent oxidoreductase [Proteobacteria bacterium]|nr:FAD-dependent oxidoreductase [Pseudomonadota bacterium]
MTQHAQSDSPVSLWADTAPAAPATDSLPSGEHRADVLVIGAGFTGLSTALAAAGRGADVVLLEAAEIGSGGSGLNNGQVIPCLSRADPDEIVAARGAGKGEALVALIRDSAQATFDLIRRHKIACDAVQNGWLQPAHTPGRVERISKPRFEQWRRRGAPVELLDQDAVAALTGSRYWHGGWRNPTGGHVDPLALARGLARAAMDAGVRLHTRSPVIGMERAGEGWLVRTDAATVLAKRVVIATNAYGTDRVWPGLDRSWVPMRSYQMATSPLPDTVRRSILPSDTAMSDTHGDLYFCRFDRRGRLVTGGALIFDRDFEPRLKRRIGDRMALLFPQIGEPSFDYVWHGQLSMTEDKLPHMHALAEGVITWVGCNGRGVALGIALGPVLADAALGAAPADLPLPLTELGRVPAHALAARIAPWMLALFRWRDAQA